METKPWWQSKTIWSGIVAVAVAVWNAFVPSMAEHFQVILPQVPEFVYAILGFFGIYSRNTATTVIR